jgi:hypothetical protein
MKNYYILLLVLLTIYSVNAQQYQYGVIHQTANTFKVVCIPDFNSSDTNTNTGNVDISDVGFTLMLPADLSEIQNVTTLLPGRTWNLNSYDASFLTGQGLGDGTKDAFLLTMNPGQSILSHTIGEHIDLVNFEVGNPPTSGDLYFLENSDPIAQGAGNVLDSFYNADIDGVGNGAGTIDYFGGNNPALDSFSFGTLSVASNVITSIKIYPNPVSDILYIQNENVDISSIELYDVHGKQLLSITDKVNQINVENLNTGIYFLKIMFDRGETTKKIIIE